MIQPRSRYTLAALKLVYRLASAVRRHGPGNVVRFALGLTRRRGLRAALGYALSRGQVAAEISEESDPRALNRQFSVSEQAWDAWLKRWEMAQAADVEDPEDRASTSPIVFVIGAGAPEAVRTTTDSIEAVHSALRPYTIVIAGDRIAAPIHAESYIVFLSAGDRLTSKFSTALRKALSIKRTEVVTFDLVYQSGDRIFPLFLPGANRAFARSVPQLYARFAMVSGALPADFLHGATEPEQHLLNWLAQRPPHLARGRWRHIGREPLVQIAVAPQLTPTPTPIAQFRALSPSVSVVICTKDKGHLTRQLVRCVLANQPDVLDVVLVANNTSSPHALKTLADLALSPKVRVIRQDGAFNFSKLANAGARVSQGAHLLFLNDDITPVSENWLQRMLDALAAPMVGAVGPLLIYPNERVQHAGMHLGYRGCAGHSLRHAHLPQDDYLCLASAAREVSTLTGAALLTPRHVFDALNGFDERLGTYLQDVDYCLRAYQSGFRNIFEPSAVLIHMESTSILEAPFGSLDSQRERENAYFAARWGETLKDDTFFPAGLSLEDERLRTLREAGGKI